MPSAMAGEQAQLKDGGSRIKLLRRSISGEVLTPADAGYDEARRYGTP